MFLLDLGSDYNTAIGPTILLSAYGSCIIIDTVLPGGWIGESKPALGRMLFAMTEWNVYLFIITGNSALYSQYCTPL